MKYAVYYKTNNKNDRSWKRSAEVYKNRKGLLASKPRTFTDYEEAVNYTLQVFNDWGYETKIVEIK